MNIERYFFTFILNNAESLLQEQKINVCKFAEGGSDVLNCPRLNLQHKATRQRLALIRRRSTPFYHFSPGEETGTRDAE